MTKDQAIRIFGRYQSDLARAIGISKQAIGRWPDPLPQSYEDRVIGAAVRLRQPIPDVRYVVREELIP